MYPFKYIVDHTNPAAVMASYNEVNAVPSHANQWLLQNVLRKEWNYKGLIVSDYDGVAHLYMNHKVAAGKDDAAELALKAGISIELPTADAYPSIPQLVNDKR